MNVHIYKGRVHKSVIFEQLVRSREVLGLVYYTSDEPYPNHIGSTYMIPRELVSEDDLINDVIPNLMKETNAGLVVIYTNHSEEENLSLIEKLQAYESLNTVILMCAWRI